MNFDSIKIFGSMLKKYGHRSVLSRNFIIIFSILLLIFMIGYVSVQFVLSSGDDMNKQEQIVQEMYNSRNSLDGAVNIARDSIEKIKDSKEMDKLAGGNFENIDSCLLMLENEMRNADIFNSIYIYFPDYKYVLSTSNIYKSSYLNEFTDLSWFDFYNEGQNLFYSEYPDIGLIRKRISYLETAQNSFGEDFVVLYNIDYSAAKLNREIYNTGVLFITDTRGNIVYCSKDKEADLSHLGEEFDYSAVNAYAVKTSSLKNNTYMVKLRNIDLLIILDAYKSWVNNKYLSIEWLLLAFILSIILSTLLSLYIAMGMYNRFTRLFSVIDIPDKKSGSASNSNEISDVLDYIMDLTKEKQYVESELLHQTMQLQHTQVIALQSQLSPHFLFNTLQLLNTYIFAEFKRDTDATKIVSIISSLLREALDTSELVRSMEREIAFTKQYLRIQEIRYPDMFEVIWDVDEELYGYNVPKCILQPLLENSIGHGFEDIERKGIIHIKARLMGEILEIRVKDNGVGIKANRLEEVRKTIADAAFKRKEKIGLCNINQRIKILFGDEYGLEIIVDNGTEIVIRLPIEQ